MFDFTKYRDILIEFKNNDRVVNLDEIWELDINLTSFLYGLMF